MDKAKLIASALIFAITFGANSFTFAATASGDSGTLANLEQKYFFKSYPTDDNETRLGRLEKRIFGDASQGDFNQRLERVKAAAGPQLNPDGTLTGETPQMAPQPQAPQKPAISPQEEREAAAQRAKVAVMAAREEEIAKLLADGVEAWRQRQGPQAIAKFEQVLSLDPSNAEAQFNMGVVYESASRFADAAASYHKAADAMPNNREYAEACAAIDKKVASTKKTDEKQGELKQLAEDAAAAFKRGEFVSALDLYKQLDSKAPNQALIKYNIGTLYFELKNYQTALDYYKQALKLKPGEPRYQQAVQRLSANLKQAEDQQKQLEAVWDQHETQEKQQQKLMAAAAKKAKNGAPPPVQQQRPMQQNPMPQQGGMGMQNGMQMQPMQNQMPNQNQAFAPLPNNAPPQDPMASIGLIAKAHKDGLIIVTVGIGSRASRVGLLQGDLIKAVDGIVVKSPNEANQIIARKQPGAPVSLMVQRSDKMGMVSL